MKIKLKKKNLNKLKDTINDDIENGSKSCKNSTSKHNVFHSMSNKNASIDNGPKNWLPIEKYLNLMVKDFIVKAKQEKKKKIENVKTKYSEQIQIIKDQIVPDKCLKII